MPLPSADTPGRVTAACRSCGQVGVEAVLSLGEMPLANRLLRPDELAAPEPRYPLDLGFCPACSLVQIGETVPPETLFLEYVYFSSFSETMLASSEALARRLTLERRLGPGQRVHKPDLTGAAAIRDRLLNEEVLVVEIASNDGYLLQFYRDLGVPILGIEPALNVARVAEERGIPTVAEFFGDELAARLVREGRRADVIHAHNVLAHVADLNGFVHGIARLLKPNGVAVIEVPYVRDLVEGAAFDTIYHEHLCYFSLTALDAAVPSPRADDPGCRADPDPRRLAAAVRRQGRVYIRNRGRRDL